MGDEVNRNGDIPGNDYDETPSLSAEVRGETIPRAQISNYPPNSHQSRSQQAPSDRTKVEPVVTGKVVTRKKPLGKRIVEAFTGDDAMTAGDYVLFEVMIPAAKATFVDAIQETAERLFFGDVRNRPRIGPGGSRVGYNQMHNQPKSFVKPQGRQQISGRARATHDFDEIVIPTRGEAELVLERLTDLLETYEVVTVSDFYDLTDVQGNGHPDERWGWFNLTGARVIAIRGGYILDLPQPEQIN